MYMIKIYMFVWGTTCGVHTSHFTIHTIAD